MLLRLSRTHVARTTAVVERVTHKPTTHSPTTTTHNPLHYIFDRYSAVSQSLVPNAWSTSAFARNVGHVSPVYQLRTAPRYLRIFVRKVHDTLQPSSCTRLRRANFRDASGVSHAITPPGSKVHDRL